MCHFSSDAQPDIVSDRNEIRYRPKASAETMGFSIGFGAEIFFSETQTFFFFFKIFKKYSIFSCISAY